MGQLLKIAGIVSTAILLFGDRITGAIYDRIEYTFGRLRRGDVRFGFSGNQAIVSISMRMYLEQNFGVTDTLTNLVISFSQQNMLLGYVDYRALVVLPAGEEVEIPFTVRIPSGPFLERLQIALTPGNNNSLLAPIVITGKAYLASGLVLPISTEMTLNDLLV